MVHILDVEIDGTLTAAFHDPQSWLCGQSFGQGHFNTSSHCDSTPTQPRRALYMAELFDHSRARLVLIIMVLAAILSGLVAGLTCHSVEVGLGVSGSVSACISSVELLLIRKYH